MSALPFRYGPGGQEAHREMARASSQAITCLPRTGITCTRCGRPMDFRTADGICSRPWATCTITPEETDV